MFGRRCPIPILVDARNGINRDQDFQLRRCGAVSNRTYRGDSPDFPLLGTACSIMVDSIITYTLSTYNQPPNPPSPPCQGGNLSGGLHEASIRGTIGERLHIYIVHYNSKLYYS